MVTSLAVVVVVVMLLVLVLVVIRSRRNSDDMPDVEMPLLTSMTMTVNHGPVFPLPTDETDPSSTEVLGVWEYMLREYGCVGGCVNA